MKAAVFKAPGRKLEIESRADPTPGPRQIVLKVARCGVCGSDLHMTESHGMVAPGSVLGHEFSGEIVALGAEVRGLRTGDRVTALPMSGCGDCDSCRAGEPGWCRRCSWNAGGYAEYACADAAGTLKLPDALSLEDGALVEPMAVSLHALRLAGSLEGAGVLVLGAGPIGLGAAYWARRLGARRVAVAAASRRRQTLAEATGVEHFIVNDDDARRAVSAVFGGLPEVVVECVGLPGTFARCIELVRPRGTLVVAGACVGTDHFLPMAAMRKQLRVLFSILYRLDDFRDSIDAIDTGGVELRGMVTDTVGMQEFPDVFEALRRPNPHCKVLLSPWDPSPACLRRSVYK